ncbi:Mg2+ transporter protein [Pelomyxa schiedti]|nr:Mg2+ transporter protein [Pelomyxa schiedti]
MMQIHRTSGIRSAAWVLYTMLDHIIDLHIVFVNQIVVEGEALDQLVMVLGESEQDDMLLRLAVARRRLANMVGRLLPKRAILHFLIKQRGGGRGGGGSGSGSDEGGGDGGELVGAYVKLYVRDVLDHVVRMLEKLKICNSLLDSVSQTYVAKVSIAVAELSNAANATMKAFGAVATLFVPLSCVTGLFGMNVRVPGQAGPGGCGSTTAFFCIVGGLVAFMLLGFLFFKHKRWEIRLLGGEEM